MKRIPLGLFAIAVSLSLVLAAAAQQPDGDDAPRQPGAKGAAPSGKDGGGRGAPGGGIPGGGAPGFGGGAFGGGGFGAWGFMGPGGNSQGTDKLLLVTNKSVQDELKLTEKQLNLIEDRQKKQRELFGEFRTMTPEEAQDEMTKFAKTNDSVITKALTAKQNKRLSEISVQLRGTRALSDPTVAKALVLTGAQKQKLEDIQTESRDAMREHFASMMPGGGGFGRGPGGAPGGAGPGGAGPGGAGPGRNGPGAPPPQAPDADGKTPETPPANAKPPAGGEKPAAEAPRRGGRGAPPQFTQEQREAMEKSMKKMNDLRTGTEEKLVAVLTEKQQAKWKELQGEPFKMQMGPPPGWGAPPGPKKDADSDAETASADGSAGKTADKPSTDKPASTRPKPPASKNGAAGKDKLPPRPPKK